MKKWVKITNSYNLKTIETFLERHPELDKVEYQVTEKIHGANFSLLIEAEDPDTVIYCKRSGPVGDEKFYNYQKAFDPEANPRLIDLINRLKYLVHMTRKTHQLYGELYGASIQKGINYGPDVQFRWYAMAVDGVVISPAEATTKLTDFKDLKVPVIGIFSPLDEGVIKMIERLPVERDSLLTPADHEGPNTMEGVVITPFAKSWRLPSGEHFYLKKKSKAFSERSNGPRKPKVKKVVRTEYTDALEEGLRFFNENRLEGIFSKYGEFRDMQDLKKFATYYFEDAFEDFQKFATNDSLWSSLTPEEQKMLKKRMLSEAFVEMKESLNKTGRV
jgi:Rnl2 family RNA ligase